MKGVEQEDDFGCGVACVAAATDTSYQESLTLFQDGKRKARETGFYCREIVDALTHAGLDYEYKYIGNIQREEQFKPGNIVFIRRSNKYPAGHYLYRWNNEWMDPWVNFPNEDRKAGFRERLSGKPIYVIYPVLPED